MGKKSFGPRHAGNEAVASARSLRVSPRKLNLVARLIRGLDVAEAARRLEFSRRRIADEVRKVLLSAVANAEARRLDADRLEVAEAYVGKSLVMKRFRPRARGRIGRYQKPFSRLTVVVRERERGEA